MIIVAVIYIPTRLGGWGHIFGVAQTHFTSINPATGKYYDDIAEVVESIDFLSAEEKQGIFEGNVRKLYKLESW